MYSIMDLLDKIPERWVTPIVILLSMCAISLYLGTEFKEKFAPVTTLRNQYLAGEPTYQNCTYIKLPRDDRKGHRVHDHPKVRNWHYGLLEGNDTYGSDFKRYTYSDNPVYNW